MKKPPKHFKSKTQRYYDNNNYHYHINKNSYFPQYPPWFDQPYLHATQFEKGVRNPHRNDVRNPKNLVISLLRKHGLLLKSVHVQTVYVHDGLCTVNLLRQDLSVVVNNREIIRCLYPAFKCRIHLNYETNQGKGKDRKDMKGKGIKNIKENKGQKGKKGNPKNQNILKNKEKPDYDYKGKGSKSKNKEFKENINQFNKPPFVLEKMEKTDPYVPILKDLQTEDIEKNKIITNAVNIKQQARPEIRQNFMMVSFPTIKKQTNGKKFWEAYEIERKQAELIFRQKYSKKIKKGFKIKDLPHPKNDSTGIIYVLVDKYGKALYVGQTVNSALSRLQAHWGNRNSGKTKTKIQKYHQTRQTPLFYVPLQLIPHTKYCTNSEFKRVALPYENFWISHLRCPLNTQIPQGNDFYYKKPAKKYKKSNKLPENRNSKNLEPIKWSSIINDHLVINLCSGKMRGLRKQLDYLLGLEDTTLENYNFDIMNKVRCNRLLNWLRNFADFANLPNKVKLLEKLLLNRVAIASLNKVKLQENKQIWFKLTFSHKVIDDLNLNKILNEPDVIKQCPNPDLLKRTKITNKLLPPTFLSMQNVTEVSIKNHNTEPLPEGLKCSCHSYIGKMNFDGHAVGAAKELDLLPTLHDLFVKGRKYRPQYDLMSVQNSIETDVNDFVNTHFATENCDTEKVKNFYSILLQKINQKLLSFPPLYNEKLNLQAYNQLKRIKEDLVILPIDKSIHDYGFICKKFYLSKIKEELQLNSTYVVQDNITDILKSHENLNNEIGLNHVDKLPYLYAIPKLHKVNFGLRWICGSSAVDPPCAPNKSPVASTPKKAPASSMSDMHKELSGILKTVMQVLSEKDQKTYANTGIKRYFIVQSINEVMFTLKQEITDFKQHTPKTWDFKTLYTKLPQKQLIDGVISSILEAFDFKTQEIDNNNILLTRKARARKKRVFSFIEENSSLKNQKWYNKEEIITLVKNVVNNSFIAQGNCCYKQVSGIPMGGNASPDLANLYLYHIEKTFIDNLVRDNQINKAKSYRYFFRYIDDILGNELATPPPPELYGCEYQETSTSVDDVSFLGARIRIERNPLPPTNWVRISVIPKEEQWSWKPTKYIHVETTAPSNQPKGIFKSQLIRTSIICTCLQDFKVEVQRIIYRLLSRGHDSKQFKSVWNSFLNERYSFLPKDKKSLLGFFKFSVKNYEKGDPIISEAPYVGRRKPVNLQFAPLPSFDSSSVPSSVPSSLATSLALSTPITYTAPESSQKTDLSLTPKAIEKEIKDNGEISCKKPNFKMDRPFILKDFQQEKTLLPNDLIKKKEVQDNTETHFLEAPFGLNNPSNWCYLNSILQMLMTLPWFQELSKNFFYKFSIRSKIQKETNFFYGAFETLSQTFTNNKFIGKTLHKSYAQYGSGQQDVTEAFSLTLKYLRLDCKNGVVNRVFPQSSLLKIKNLLLQINRRFTCDNCQSYYDKPCANNMITVYPEKFKTLNTESKGWRIPSLQFAIEKGFQEAEVLKAETRSPCGSCNHQSSTTLTTTITNTPETFFVHLIRNHPQAFSHLALEYPVTLTPTITVRNTRYDLCAVICHIGKRTDGGHYITYVMRNEVWFLTNDELVTPLAGLIVEPEHKPYLLAYQINKGVSNSTTPKRRGRPPGSTKRNQVIESLSQVSMTYKLSTLEIMDQLRQKEPAPPIVVTSSPTEETLQCSKCGATRSLNTGKPFTTTTLGRHKGQCRRRKTKEKEGSPTPSDTVSNETVVPLPGELQ